MRRLNRPFAAIAILLVALILGACQTLPPPPAVPLSEQNKAIVQRFGEEVFNEGNLDVIDELVAPSVVVHDPPVPEDIRGVEGVKQWITTIRTAFPDFHVTYNLFAEGDTVTKQWTATGTNEGPLADIPPTGNQVMWAGVSLYRLADGKLVELSLSYDTLSFMQQLGLIPSPEEAAQPPTTPTAENKALVRRPVEELFNKGNLAIADELFAPDYVNHDLANQVFPPGPEGMQQYVSMVRAAFPDLHTTVEDQIAEGDKVVSRLVTRGTHKGELAGIAPTNKQVTVPTIVIDRIADGKIVETWVILDRFGMMQQLGVIPPPGQAEE